MMKEDKANLLRIYNKTSWRVIIQNKDKNNPILMKIMIKNKIQNKIMSNSMKVRRRIRNKTKMNRTKICKMKIMIMIMSFKKTKVMAA